MQAAYSSSVSFCIPPPPLDYRPQSLGKLPEGFFLGFSGKFELKNTKTAPQVLHAPMKTTEITEIPAAQFEVF
jgi:hypothetical protein